MSKSSTKLTAILFILIFSLSFSIRSEDIHEDWVQKDVVFINQVKEAYKKGPEALSKIYISHAEITDLGFGYTLYSGCMGKGYVSTCYEFVKQAINPYQNNISEKVVAYRLQQRMPKHEKLTERYIELYKGLFEVVDNRVLPKLYNYQYMVEPLAGNITDIETSKDFDYLMTPFSGTTYGYSGGYANSLLENRRIYEKLNVAMTEAHYERLLYSKNPATRLMAVEYFYSKNDVPGRIINRIEVVFDEVPNIDTLSGCLGSKESSRELVDLYVKLKKENERLNQAK